MSVGRSSSSHTHLQTFQTSWCIWYRVACHIIVHVMLINLNRRKTLLELNVNMSWKSTGNLLGCISCTGWRLQSGLHLNMQPSCTSVIPYRRALSGGRCRGSSVTPFQFILITDRQQHPTLYRRWLSFPVATARVWNNSLPDLVTSAPSVAVFRSRLKTHLLNISYPSPLWLYSACTVMLSCFWTL